MISIKGQGTALAEQLSNSREVSVQASLGAPASISPQTQTFAATGGTGNVTVTSATSCSWTTLSNAPWLTVTSSSTGNGNGIVSFTVVANTGTQARTGSILISGQIFSVTQAAIPPAPVLLNDETSGRAAALDSVLFLRDPLSIVNLNNFSLDHRTRLSLFATNIDLNPGENISAISAQAEDSQHVIHPLTVEFVGKVPNLEWLTQINIRLPDSLANSGDIRLSISLRGVPSNQVLFRLKP